MNIDPIYTGTNSPYLQQTNSWHAEDSPWKAKQILKSFLRNNINPKSITEVGCGVGEILFELEKSLPNKIVDFEGYDIAEDALKIALKKMSDKISFYQKDFLEEQTHSDVLLMIDVFEHVEDYLGFIKKCKDRATYKVFHIPLDLSVSSLLRNRMLLTREKVGHLHYFSKETALATIQHSGLTIVDSFYTQSAFANKNKKFKTKFANVCRKILYYFSPDLTVKLFGGFSLMVVAK